MNTRSYSLYNTTKKYIFTSTPVTPQATVNEPYVPYLAGFHNLQTRFMSPLWVKHEHFWETVAHTQTDCS